MSEHAESPSQRVILLGSFIGGVHEVLSPLVFSHEGSLARAHTYNPDWHEFLCQYIEGKRDGEQFQVPVTHMKDIVGKELQLVINNNVDTPPNMYTAEAARQSTRVALIALLIISTLIGLKCVLDHFPDQPKDGQKPAVVRPEQGKNAKLKKE